MLADAVSALKRRYGYVLALLLVGVLVVAGWIYVSIFRIHTEPVTVALPVIADVPQEHWHALAGKKILFAHKELGDQIVAGLQDLLPEVGLAELPVVSLEQSKDAAAGFIAHGHVGRCFYPQTKIDEFLQLLDEGLSPKPDIAILKFCFSDIRAETDLDLAISQYRRMVDQLRRSHPAVTIMHVTVPLCTRPGCLRRGFRETAKCLVGRPSIWQDNLCRQKFNTFLKDTYSHLDPLFDLALVESCTPAGQRYYAFVGGRKVYLLAGEHAVSTGVGTLNQDGSRWVAEQFLIALAEAAHKKDHEASSTP
ncbi:MAG TPA: SGNH/GDSL hydrolase family protein [Phycisphaerae bacterium]|nr:SGNH/GDSL hydrolase family protein [Phycisphaerae bacterium]